MSTSKPSPADKRQRQARKVPRRHEDSAEKKAGATYDSGEFPVLLRMPDVTITELSVTSVPTDDESIEDNSETESTAQSNSSPPRRKKHHHERRRGKSESSTEGSRLTALAAAQFWRSLAPKIAVGGMLLAVLAICGVMFMGPRNSDMTSELNKPEWTNHTAANPRHDQHPHDATNATARETSVLSKQDAVRSGTVAPKLDRDPALDTQIQPYAPSENTQDIPSSQSDPNRSFDLPNSYPRGSLSIPNAGVPANGNGEPTPAAQDLNGPFHAQGWPDDADVGGGAGPDTGAAGNAPEAGHDPGVQLNAAGNNSAPQLRTSHREQRIQSMPNAYPRGSLTIPNAGLPTQGRLPTRGNGPSAAANPSADGAYGNGTRLDGTVEITHPSRTSYR